MYTTLSTLFWSWQLNKNEIKKIKHASKLAYTFFCTSQTTTVEAVWYSKQHPRKMQLRSI